MKKIIYLLVSLVGIICMYSCDLDIAPADSLTGDQMRESPTGTTDIVNGCYAIMKDWPGENDWGNNWYGRQFYQMADFSSDDVVYGQSTTDELNMIFRYDERHPGLSNVTSFWSQSYRIIYSANVAIDVLRAIESPTAEDNYLLGEALFLKAFSMHCLTRLYCKPYKPETAESLPGIIIRENSADGQNKDRATLQYTYEYIEGMLLEAEGLMLNNSSSRSSDRSLSSLAAVQALLSRVYLYMHRWDDCVSYATKVIENTNYKLEEATSFPTYFTETYNRQETIWCLKMLPEDDKESASVASMIYKADGCWGEEGYSDSLLEDMGEGTALEDDDARWSFVCEVNPKNGLNLYPCSKASNQDGKPTLFSPPFIRLSEMYFNRAEALAHSNGSETDILNDINEVRRHRMTANVEEHLYTAQDIPAGGILDLVLKEKRVEFAFEGHRIFDLLRNDKDIIRDYWGYHTNYTVGTSTTAKPDLSLEGVTTPYDYDRLVFPIPTQEINNNPSCKQNAGY